MNYYIGPWQWKTEDEHSFWAAPDSTVGLVDLRPLAACAARGSHALNFGFFATEKLLDSSYVALGSDLEVLLTLAQRDAWCQTVGIPSLTGRVLLDVLIETLTVQADPEQGRRVQGLRPGQTGQFELLLAGQRIWTRPFVGLADPAWPRLKQAIQIDFRKNFEQDSASLTDREVHRRLLTDWMGKYKISDWREFVPGDLLEDVEGPLLKRTTVSDDFDRGNESLDVGNWDEVDGNWFVDSNAALNDTGGSSPACARYRSALSSDDHYAQVVFVWAQGTVSPFSAVARFDGAAKTFYWGLTRADLALLRLSKCVVGSNTQLDADDGQGSGPVVTVKLETDGTAIKLYLGGVEKLSAIDATISGNTRCGMSGSHVSARGAKGDDFIAADLGAPPSFIPYPFSRGLRGGNHVLSGGLS